MTYATWTAIIALTVIVIVQMTGVGGTPGAGLSPNKLSLRDGVLVAERTRIELIKAEWTLVMTIEPPWLPKEFEDHVLDLQAAVQEAIQRKHIPSNSIETWQFRLEHLQHRVRLSEEDLVTPTRTRRGILDFVGNTFGPKFGFASKNDLGAIRRAMRASQSAFTQVIYFSNILATGITHAYDDDEISVDRARINGIATELSNVTNRIN